MFFDKSIPRSKVKTSLIVLPLALSSFFLGAIPANAATDIFLKMGDIKGESVVKGHEEEIQALDWNWGMSQSGTTHMGTGGGAGKLRVQDISFTKNVDAATPHLIQACANGKHFPEAVLTLRKAGESPLDYLVITLTNVIVTSVSMSSTAGAEQVTEVVSLNFAKFKVSYQRQDPKGGKLGGTIDAVWNIAENVAK